MSLTILTGNIGCGKSLIAKKLAKNGAFVVNMDTIQSMGSGGEYGMYDYDKKDVYLDIENVAIGSSLRDGFDVVVDRNNMDKEHRKRFIDIGKRYTDDIICFDFGKGNYHDIQRRYKNNRGVSQITWSKAWDYMLKSYEQPALDEGFTHIRFPAKTFKYHAFDFDGTITENTFPSIGELRPGIVEKIKELWCDLSNIIIIWTCRSGDKNAEMREFLLKNNIPFDFINENPMFDTGSNKVFAHYYYDDRGVIV